MKEQNKKSFKSQIIIVFLFISLFISLILALVLGAEKVSLAAVFGQGDKFENIILWQLRFPRVLLVFITGLLLGGSGAVFQLFFIEKRKIHKIIKLYNDFI